MKNCRKVRAGQVLSLAIVEAALGLKFPTLNFKVQHCIALKEGSNDQEFPKTAVTEDPCMHCEHLKLLVRLKGAVPLLSNGIFFREIEYYILVKRKKEKQQLFFLQRFFQHRFGVECSYPLETSRPV